VTPGSTASDASRTTPASVACACAMVGVRTRNPARIDAGRQLSHKRGASCGNVCGLLNDGQQPM